MTGAELDVSLPIGDRGLRSFAMAFAITQLVEVPIYLAALRRRKAPGSIGARGAIAFGASLLTHPIVWFAMPAWSMWLYTACAFLFPMELELGVLWRMLLYGALAEGFAVVAEALYLRAFGVRRALVWSMGANAASVIVGTLVVWGLDR